MDRCRIVCGRPPAKLRRADEEQHLSQTLSGVTTAFPLGTDQLGRDILARMALGGAISLAIGLCAAGISVFIGTVVGVFAGYVGGRAPMRF